MSEPAIHIEHVSKRYRLGLLHHRSRSIRDRMATMTRGLWSHIAPSRRAQRFQISEADLSDRNSEIWALREVSLTIAQGEVFGIIGANGAGKSTLLKVLARITRPTEGRVVLSGKVGSLLEVGTGFHPEMTGRENIFLNGSLLGMSRTEIDDKFDNIVQFSEIEAFLDTPVKRYSSGMYVRLAFAVAAHLDPDILLVDEVLAVGDLSFQKKCLGKMNEVTGEGRTVLLVSHQMSAIQGLCNRAAWIDKGRIVALGPARDVVRRYEESQIRHGEGMPANVKRSNDHPHNQDLFIRMVELRDESGNTTSTFAYNDILNLKVGVANRQAFSNFSLEFRIYKNMQEFACVGSSGLLHGLYFNNQVREIRIAIGPIPLTKGNYSISLRILEDDRIIDNWDHACSFNVSECHPFPKPREITAPVCVIPHVYEAL